MKTLLTTILLLIASAISAQCYNPNTQQAEHGLLVKGAYSFHYGNKFIGNNFSMGYSIGAIGVMVGYHEFRRGQDTARQSFGVTLLHDLNRGKVVGTLFLTHGTRNFTEAGIMARLTGQTPLYLSLSTQSVQIGLLVKL